MLLEIYVVLIFQSLSKLPRRRKSGFVGSTSSSCCVTSPGTAARDQDGPTSAPSL